MKNEIKCPNCGSTQLTTNKNGYSAAKGISGVILTGGIGLAAGFIGSGKVKITCLDCGNKFNPGEGLKDGELSKKEKLYASIDFNKESSISMKIGIVSAVIALILFLLAFLLLITGNFSIAGTLALYGLLCGVIFCITSAIG